LNPPVTWTRKAPVGPLKKELAPLALCLPCLPSSRSRELIYLRLHGSALLERRMQGWLSQHGWRAGVARNLLGFVRGVQTSALGATSQPAVIYSGLHWLLVACVYLLVLQSFGRKTRGAQIFRRGTHPRLQRCRLRRATSRRRRWRTGSFSRCFHSALWSRKRAGSSRRHDSVAGNVRVLLFCRRSSPSPRRLVAGELKRMREREGEQIEAELAGQARHKEFVGTGLAPPSWVALAFVVRTLNKTHHGDIPN